MSMELPFSSASDFHLFASGYKIIRSAVAPARPRQILTAELYATTVALHVVPCVHPAARVCLQLRPQIARYGKKQ